MLRLLSVCTRGTITTTRISLKPCNSQILFGRSVTTTSLSTTNKPVFFSTFKTQRKDRRSTQQLTLFTHNTTHTHHPVTHLAPFKQVRQFSLRYTIREKLMQMRHTMRMRMLSMQRYTPLSPVRTFVDRYRPRPDTWEQFKSRKLAGKIGFVMRRMVRFIQDLGAGAKGLFFNWRALRTLRRQVAEENREMTREEFFFERQFKSDVRKILPILVIWKLIPLSAYWLPFVLVTYPSYLPSTFKLGPKPQIDDVLARTRYWQAYYLRHHSTTAPQLKTALQIRDKFPVNGAWVGDLEREIVRGFERVSPQLWSSSQLKAVLAALNVRKPLTSFWPHFWAVKMFDQHFAELHLDDQYLRREGVQSLTTEQVAEALLARGLRVQLLSDRRMRSELEEWLKVSEQYGYDELKQLALVYYGCAKLRGRIHLQPSTDRTALAREEQEHE